MALEIVCRACGGPLTGREGKFVLKYFLLRRGSGLGVEPKFKTQDGHSGVSSPFVRYVLQNTIPRYYTALGV